MNRKKRKMKIWIKVENTKKYNALSEWGEMKIHIDTQFGQCKCYLDANSINQFSSYSFTLNLLWMQQQQLHKKSKNDPAYRLFLDGNEIIRNERRKEREKNADTSRTKTKYGSTKKGNNETVKLETDKNNNNADFRVVVLLLFVCIMWKFHGYLNHSFNKSWLIFVRNL